MAPRSKKCTPKRSSPSMDSGKKGRKSGREFESKEEDTSNNQDNRKKINLESVVASMLECPVCLKVPRDLPIPSCPAGHIICKLCRASVTSCPTCRRILSPDGTSSLAASLIEHVLHKCKFEVHGCQFKDVLGEVKKYEEICSEKTIKCPLTKYQAEVQMKKYKDHVIDNKCYTFKTVSGMLTHCGTYKHVGGHKLLYACTFFFS